MPSQFTKGLTCTSVLECVGLCMRWHSALQTLVTCLKNSKIPKEDTDGGYEEKQRWTMWLLSTWCVTEGRKRWAITMDAEGCTPLVSPRHCTRAIPVPCWSRACVSRSLLRVSAWGRWLKAVADQKRDRQILLQKQKTIWGMKAAWVTRGELTQAEEQHQDCRQAGLAGTLGGECLNRQNAKEGDSQQGPAPHIRGTKASCVRVRPQSGQWLPRAAPYPPKNML